MEQNKKSTLVARQTLRPGQQLFGYNLDTNEVLELGRPKKVEVKPNIIYRVALNKKNFIRKLNNEVKRYKLANQANESK